MSSVLQRSSYVRGQAVVVGAGLVGLASAYNLARSGWKVHVVDRRQQEARECSWGNACLFNPNSMLPKYVSIMDIPRLVHYNLPQSAGKYPPPPTMIAFDELVNSRHMHRFGLAYLMKRTSINEDYQALKTLNSLGTKEMLRIAGERGGYDVIKGGYLNVHTSLESLASSIKQFQEFNVEPIRILDEKALLDLEPSLEFYVTNQKNKGKDVYGLWFPNELTAEPTSFSKILKQMCDEEGVTFDFGASVTKLKINHSKIQDIEGVQLSNGSTLDADIFVLCAGVFSARLADTVGIKLPIYPLKGHSLTLSGDLATAPATLGRPFSLADSTILFTPIPGTKNVRVTGFGDFVGHWLGPEGVDRARLESLVTEAQSVIPQALPERVPHDSLLNWIRADQTISDMTSDPIKAWSGLRPFTPDSNPLIGKSDKYKNLFFNAGHGQCGWMMSTSSAMLLTNLVNNLPPIVNPKPYRVDRYKNIFDI
jgi:D-amino-acid dehydrogenase